MSKKLFLAGICAVFVVCIRVNAQTMVTGKETRKATVNFTELANYYKAHPLPATRKPLFNENEEKHPQRVGTRTSLTHLLDRKTHPGSKPAHGADLPVSPAPTDTFESTASDLTGIPPDTHGAVDSQFCVTAINTSIHIQSRSGYSYSELSLDGFWNSLEVYGPGAYDPRVHYDEIYHRWIMVGDAYGLSSYSMIFVAVSQTEDPRGSWNMYSINVDATGAAWMDFPNVGYNKKWIAITGNMFPNSSGGASGAVIFLINYQDVMAGTGAPYVKFSEPSSFSICPTLTYDTTEPNLFLMENWDNTTGKLRLWKVSGSVSAPSLTTVGYPQTTTTWQSSPSSGSGDFLPQTSTSLTMDAGDDRITSCTYRNHHLWCSHTIFLPASGATSHTSVLWWEVDTTAHPLQVGEINDPSAGKFYAYSSIAVNNNDDALIGMGYFSHSLFASGAYALHMHTDGSDSTRPVEIFRHGQAEYYCTYGGGRNRWGDYSATCIDPRNDTDFWTIQESTIIGTSPNWDTWWASVQFCPKPLQPTLSLTPAAPCQGAAVTYAVVPVTGATSYSWSVSGTGWSGTGTGDTATLTAGTTTGTISVLAYNACGEGQAHVFTVTPHSTPHQPHITEVTPACVGGSTATFSGTSPGATSFSWVALDSGWSGTSSTTSLHANIGSGTGMIICTATNACGPGTPDTIFVTPAVVPVVSFHINTHVEATGAIDTLSYTGTYPAGSTFTWNFAGATSVPGTGVGPQYLSWSTTGWKHVTLTVSNAGCTASFEDSVLVQYPTELMNVYTGAQGIRISPNPAQGSFGILFNKAVTGTVEITMFDIRGDQTIKREYQAQQSSIIPMDATGLKPGTYLLSVTAEGITYSEKLTLE